MKENWEVSVSLKTLEAIKLQGVIFNFSVKIEFFRKRTTLRVSRVDEAKFRSPSRLTSAALIVRRGVKRCHAGG